MQIKIIGVGLAALLLSATAISSTAMAADLPSRRAPPPVYVPPPLPVFSWTGLYVGGQVGYEFGKSNGFASAASNGAGLAAAGGNTNGVIGGAHVGYNYQVQSIPALGGFGGGGLVLGVEGDVDGSSARANYLLGGISNTAQQNIMGSARGRLGLAVDRVLFYATGGAAFGSLQNNYTNTLNGLSDSFSHTKVGWTVGGGVEYAITNNWSLRAEYRYTDFGTVTDNLAGSTAGGVNVRHRETDNRVQAGFSYKFDTFTPVAPVVARY